MSKLTEATRGKKILCNPPVLAKVQSAEAMIEQGYVSEEGAKRLIECDERFVAEYDKILSNEVSNLGV